MTTHCHYSLFGLEFERSTIKQAWHHFCDVMEALDRLPDGAREWGPPSQASLQDNARHVAKALGLPPYTFTVISFGKDAQT